MDMHKHLGKFFVLLLISSALLVSTTTTMQNNNRLLKLIQEKPYQVITSNISTIDATIYWQSNIKSTYALNYKKSSEDTTYSRTDEVKIYGDGTNNPIIYAVNISKLQPNTQYDFQISSSDNIWNTKYTFKTMPIGDKIQLPNTVTGRGDTMSLYLLDIDGEKYILDTQHHGTWAFDSQGKPYTVQKYASYAHKDNTLTLLKNRIINKIFAHEDYKTSDGVRDGMVVNNSQKIRHCADVDGCVCIFGDQNSTDRMNINLGESCSVDKKVTDSIRCCRSADGKTAKWISVKECLKTSSNTINVYEEEAKCTSSSSSETTNTQTNTDTQNTNSDVYAKFPSDGYQYDSEDLFDRLITGDYRYSNNIADINNVTQAWNWTRPCKDVDGCICQYEGQANLNVAVGETCLKDRQKKDTVECCLYEDNTKREYITVKECMKKPDFQILENTTKEKCESEYVCCSLNGNLKYKLSSNCQAANGVSISGVQQQNCKAQTKDIVISKGVNFIEAYYILSAETPINTAKGLIEYSQNKIASVGIFKNDKWEKLVVQENGIISGEDFDLLPNESYLIIATEELKIPTTIVVSQKTINLDDYVGWNLFSSTSVASSTGGKTSDEIFSDPKYDNVRQIAQWSSDSSNFKYAVKDINGTLYGDTLTITDQAGVFIKTQE
ncbi:MAG TPA: fibronectin type III domain-containing protein [Candidatus Dojkabacteria bacterium]|nr:fibronectin type III domain-containing protein [Candidatus Dojkabacteria bacterium]